MQDIIEKAVGYLTFKYKAKTILLYGSFASQAANNQSDIDLIVLADTDAEGHDSSQIDSHILDAWIYPINRWEDPSTFTHVYPFRILMDELGVAEKLEASILEQRIKATKILSAAEYQQLVSWIKKMLNRATQNTVEANYRYNWLLHEVPELYANLSGIYYDGPVKTLRRIKEQDPDLYQQYETLLATGKNVTLLDDLYGLIIDRSDLGLSR